MPAKSFEALIQTVIDNFERRTPLSLLHTLDPIREITGAKQLMSMYSTNWKYTDIDVGKLFAQLHVYTMPS